MSDKSSGLKGHFEFSDSVLPRLPAAQAVAEGFLCILLRKSVHLESGFICFVFFFCLPDFSINTFFNR